VPVERAEGELLDAARRGERDAMEALVLLHQDRVFTVLRRCVPDREVEDLAQEAFLRAFRHLDHFRGEARFGTWLFQVVRNLLIDRHRSRRRAPEKIGLHEETGDPADVVIADPSAGPAEAYDRRMVEERLRAALDRLAEKDRLAVLLHDQEGMSAAEVATVVGGSAGALRIRLMRARGKLRGWLREES
jgi:RNA polymerase sigma-70 factor (ECF subfamily)